jgi:drug/metabolite transporter superfamily protein YnfA
MFKVAALFALLTAAYLEIHGDVTVGRGLQQRSALTTLYGAAILAIYGVVVNLYNVLILRASARTAGPPLDFTRLLGIYIACFAAMNLWLGYRRSPDGLSRSTVAGTIVIGIGGLIIQWGPRIFG